MTINGPKIYFTIPIFGGIPITQTLVTSFLVTVILCVTGVLMGRKLTKRPGKRQVLAEKAVQPLRELNCAVLGRSQRPLDALYCHGVPVLSAGDPAGHDRHPPLLHRRHQHHHDLGCAGQLYLLV